ncbi:MAG: hypothetical protein C0433_00280 [Cyclobacterium sp.]|nr:hypothetical protein [Cyclobacterium sp.]
MVNIRHKSTTLRKSIGQAIVKVSLPETIQAIQNRTVRKGDVFECARVAGLFASKRTADMIPDCHPLPVKFTGVSFEIGALGIYLGTSCLNLNVLKYILTVMLLFAAIKLIVV